MKSLIAIVVALATAAAVSAQTTNIFIKGSLDIRFGTRNQTAATDRYALNVNVCDSALFQGTVLAKPFAPGTFSDQNGSLTYSVACDVVNPKNPSQTKNVGTMSGVVPVDSKNVYRFADGNLKISILSVGTAKEFNSKFSGLALGKPPQASGMIAKIKQDAINLTKNVNGKTVGITVTKYDKMEFQNHVMAAGPVQIYPEVTLNGAMLYDYARNVWYFQNVTAVYSVDGRQLADRLSGNIRWVESPNRKSNGEGQYEFDIRLNEPPPGESAVFSAAQDESAFFETDSSIASLNGTMKYKDTISGDSVIASAVQIDLTGNKLTKQQAMYLCKMLMISTIVPMNAE